MEEETVKKNGSNNRKATFKRTRKSIDKSEIDKDRKNWGERYLTKC